MASQEKSSNAKKPAAQARVPQPETPGHEEINQRASAAALIQRALASPQPPPPNPNDVLTLQRMVGNRAVNRLLTRPGRLRSPGPAAFPVQARLTVGPADDHFEQEADRVAAQVVGQMASPAPPGPVPAKPEARSLQTAPAGDAIRRPMRLEDEEGMQETVRAAPVQPQQPAEAAKALRRKAPSRGDAGLSVPPEVETSIHAARGGGRPLTETTRRSMENAFDLDFGGVRVHTDARADTLNRSVEARAFTTGRDIFFREGEYQPGSTSGQTLIAHELTHVAQQTAAPARRLQTKRSGPAAGVTPSRLGSGSARPIQRWGLKNILGGLLGAVGGAFYQAGRDAYQWGRSAYQATGGNAFAAGAAGLGGLIKGLLWGPFRGAYMGWQAANHPHRSVEDMVRTDFAVPGLGTSQLTDLQGVHNGINTAGLIQLGQAVEVGGVGGRPVTEIVQLANAVQGLTAPQVVQLCTVHAGIDLGGLIQLGQAFVGAGLGGRGLGDIVQLANGEQALTNVQVIRLYGIHGGINAAGLIQIGQAFVGNNVGGRSLNHIVQLANGVQGLTAPQVVQLCTVHGAIDTAGLIQIGQAFAGNNVGGRGLGDIVQLAAGEQALTAPQVVQMCTIHGGINTAGLIQLGQALVANNVGGRGLGDIVQLANGEHGLSAAQVLQLCTVHAGINAAGLIQIGQALVGAAVGGRGLADIIQLANGEQALTAPQVVQMCTIHGGINTAGLIQLAQAIIVGGVGARPLADTVTLANGMHALTVAELALLVILNVGGALGEYIVQDAIHRNRTADDVINEIHTNANTGQRRVVANHDALRAVIRERWNGGDATAITATLLEGSLHWPHGSGPDSGQGYRIRSGTTFADWIRGGNEHVGRPVANAISTMNCWEGVLFAAYLAGKITYVQLTTVHNQAAANARLANPLVQGGVPHTNAVRAYFTELGQFLNVHTSVLWDRNALIPQPLPRGNILFFTQQAVPTNMDKLAHVAISLGRGVGGNAEIMSLWNVPNVSVFQYLTINQLMVPYGMNPPNIYHAASPW